MKKLLIGLIVLASTNVMAQESKWYVGGELGASKVDNQTPYIANSFVSEEVLLQPRIKVLALLVCLLDIKLTRLLTLN
jgi:hypothetical protein